MKNMKIATLTLIGGLSMSTPILASNSFLATQIIDDLLDELSSNPVKKIESQIDSIIDDSKDSSESLDLALVENIIGKNYINNEQVKNRWKLFLFLNNNADSISEALESCHHEYRENFLDYLNKSLVNKFKVCEIIPPDEVDNFSKDPKKINSFLKLGFSTFKAYYYDFCVDSQNITVNNLIESFFDHGKSYRRSYLGGSNDIIILATSTTPVSRFERWISGDTNFDPISKKMIDWTPMTEVLNSHMIDYTYGDRSDHYYKTCRFINSLLEEYSESALSNEDLLINVIPKDFKILLSNCDAARPINTSLENGSEMIAEFTVKSSAMSRSYLSETISKLNIDSVKKSLKFHNKSMKMKIKQGEIIFKKSNPLDRFEIIKVDKIKKQYTLERVL